MDQHEQDALDAEFSAENATVNDNSGLLDFDTVRLEYIDQSVSAASDSADVHPRSVPAQALATAADTPTVAEAVDVKRGDGLGVGGAVAGMNTSLEQHAPAEIVAYEEAVKSNSPRDLKTVPGIMSIVAELASETELSSLSVRAEASSPPLVTGTEPAPVRPDYEKGGAFRQSGSTTGVVTEESLGRKDRISEAFRHFPSPQKSPLGRPSMPTSPARNEDLAPQLPRSPLEVDLSSLSVGAVLSPARQPPTARRQTSVAVSPSANAADCSFLDEMLDLPSNEQKPSPPPNRKVTRGSTASQKETKVAAVNLLTSDEESEGQFGGDVIPGVVPKLSDYSEYHAPRPAAPVLDPSDLAETEKKTIFVLHRGQVTVVSWSADMEVADMRESIACTCHAIANGGFQLRRALPIQRRELEQLLADGESRLGGKLMKVLQNGREVWYRRGQVYQFEDFDRLETDGLYSLEMSIERDDLKSILGDRFRRFYVDIDPLRHVESQKAIARMRQGTNLLKRTSYGQPHLRHFQLSADLKRLLWYSGSKSKEETMIKIDTITEVKVGAGDGHQELVFLNPISFRIMAGVTLDLAAKDEEEFDLWVAGLKALACWSRGRKINKMGLLGHSRRFRQAIGKADAADEQIQEPVSLARGMRLDTLGKSELVKKENRLRLRVDTAREKARLVDREALKKTAQLRADETPPNQENDLCGAVAFVEDHTDEEMEFSKMRELMGEAAGQLDRARTALDELDSTPSKDNSQASSDEGLIISSPINGPSPAHDTPEDSPSPTSVNRRTRLAEITAALWRAEVDVENIEDIYCRLMSPPGLTLQRKFSDLNTTVSNDLAELKKNLKAWFTHGSQSVLPMFFSASDPLPRNT